MSEFFREMKCIYQINKAAFCICTTVAQLPLNFAGTAQYG
jgi:hypothetical protein